MTSVVVPNAKGFSWLRVTPVHLNSGVYLIKVLVVRVAVGDVN